MKKKAAIFSLVFCLLLSACGGGDKEPAATPTPAPTATPEPTGSQTTDYTKYNTYIDLLDTVYQVDDFLTAYFEQVETQEEFALTEGGDYSLIGDELGLVYTKDIMLFNNLDGVEKLSPSYPGVDEAYVGMIDSIKILVDVMEDMSSYLAFDSFEEDGYAKAKEFHASIWDALDAYDQWAGQFANGMDELNKSTRGDDLANLEQSGEVIMFHSASIIYTAQDIEDLFWDQIGEDGAATGLDTTGLDELVAELKNHLTALRAAMEDPEERDKIYLFWKSQEANSPFDYVDIYSDDLNGLETALDALVEQAAAGGDLLEPLYDFNEAVSELIDSYNNYLVG
ncbi:DUF3829 domain-containing protein [Pseudoflavonifractor sp. 524-17]|uniref:DUF3829 domain-containing protein n=1 Tax=Pseudoflavonifractor sp. 524-17 TaxID=2304577 RepID=UPI00137988C3|nr:DUF3829 domain-containing protein [Pseudoflavonifractor sp. 524-17]NCE63824.1 DUF3829 domain-containing protein [Pseudoflavonifractor sp. 524-17]